MILIFLKIEIFTNLKQNNNASCTILEISEILQVLGERSGERDHRSPPRQPTTAQHLFFSLCFCPFINFFIDFNINNSSAIAEASERIRRRHGSFRAVQIVLGDRNNSGEWWYQSLLPNSSAMIRRLKWHNNKQGCFFKFKHTVYFKFQQVTISLWRKKDVNDLQNYLL